MTQSNPEEPPRTIDHDPGRAEERSVPTGPESAHQPTSDALDGVQDSEATAYLPSGDATDPLKSTDGAGIESGSDPSLRQFGDYELEREIARGGMGVVYQARQISLNRPVALKMILSAQLASEVDVQRFRVDAEAAANLDHPGIVPIHEVGEIDGQHFFSMGLVEGGSLADLVKDGALPPRQAAELVKTIAGAVQYAHARNIVHRDLKPVNILIGADGQPKVTDFGLAKNVQGDSGLTATGQIMGTPSYMPPEQAAGKMHEIGPLADVYSLGAILYCLLTGQPPFRGDSVLETLKQVQEREPVSPRQLNDKVDLDLATITLKCLEKNPAARYRSAAELAEELDRYLGGETITARPISPPERLWRWCRRNPVLASVAAIALLAPVVGTIVSTYFAIQSSRNAEHFQTQYERAEGLLGEKNAALLGQLAATKKANARRIEAEEAKEGLRSRLYVSDMNLARQLYNDGAMDQLRERLRRHIHKNSESDLRGFEWYYWQRAAHLHVANFLPTSSLVGRPPFLVAVSPDGKTVVTGHFGHDVIVHNNTTRGVVRTIKIDTPLFTAPSALVFSRDGSVLLVAWPESVIRRFDTHTWTKLPNLAAHERRRKIVDVAVASSAPYMASVDDEGNTLLWNTETWKPIEKLLPKKGIRRVALSPDGKTLNALLKTGEIGRASGWSTLSPEGRGQGEGKITWETVAKIKIDSSYAEITSLAYCPDSRLFAVGAERRVLLFDQEFRPLHSFDALATVTSVSFSPDGSRLAAGIAKENAIRVWNTNSQTLEATIKGHANDILSIAFSRDGKNLWSAGDYTVKVWDLARCQPYDMFPQSISFESTLAYSFDGRTLFVHCTDGTIGRWDVAGRKHLAPWNGGEPFSEVAFSDDGRFLAARTKKDGTLRVWDLVNDKLIGDLPVNGTLRGGQWYQKKQPLAVSRDAQTLAWTQIDAKPSPTIVLVRSLSSDKSKKIEVEDRRGLNELSAVALSPVGKRMAAVSLFNTWLWDLSGAKPIRRPDRLFAYTPENCLAFSPDGNTLAIGSWNNDIRIHDAKTGTLQLTLRGHAGPVTCLAFSHAETRLVSGSADGTVRIWNPKIGELLCTLTGHSEPVVAVAFSPDGASVASCSQDGTVRIWDAKLSYVKELSPTLLVTLDRRVANKTATQDDLQLRALIHARQGKWKKAAADFDQVVQLTANQADLPLAFQTPWWIVGGYPGDLKASFAPETNPDPFEPVAGPRSNQVESAMVRWSMASSSENGPLDLSPYCEPKNFVSAYAFTRFYAPRERTVATLIGFDDQLRLWLDGELVCEKGGGRSLVPDEFAVELKLKAGWNTFLAKVVNLTSDHGLALRLSDSGASLAKAVSGSLMDEDPPELVIDLVSFPQRSSGYSGGKVRTVSPGDQYRLIPGEVGSGVEPYTDRKYKITNLPAQFHGLTLLQTMMGHKVIRDREFAIVLTASEPGYVFLAVDERMLNRWENTAGLPDWFRGFQRTEYRIHTDDRAMIAQGGYPVFAKAFSKGEVRLGAPHGEPTNAMYFAFFAAAERAEEILRVDGSSGESER